MDITALHTTVSPQTGGDSDGNGNAKEEEKQTASASLLSILPWQRENLARRKTASPEQDFWKIEDEMFLFFLNLGQGLFECSIPGTFNASKVHLSLDNFSCVHRRWRRNFERMRFHFTS